MATNVPPPTFGPTGFVPPTEQAILAGVQADLNQAFGTTLNFGTPTNPTPQGQIAASWAAIYGQACSMFCALANNVDPAFADGRMQDAIARIYFLERDPGESTVVQCVCIGLANTVIPFGALALSTDGRVYLAATTATIPDTGSVTMPFSCSEVGPIACPANSLNTIYRTIPGWDSINNPADGVLGSNVESRAAFEQRREETVAANTVGFVPSVRGAVEKVSGVLDAYVVDNPNSYHVAYTPAAVIQGSISGTTLTVDSVIAGTIKVGQSVTGSSGTDVGVADGTEIVSGSGTSWQVNNSQTVVTTTMQLGGVVLGQYQLYVAVVGGTEQDVAKAIWSKKSPGCPYYPGNTMVTVYDADVQYTPPGVPYTVVYEIPPSLPFVVQVNIANNPGIPSDAEQQVAAAIIAAFAGADVVGQRVRIGTTVFASRFYPPLLALGSWVEIVSLFLGVPTNPHAQVTASIGATFTATASGANLTVAGSPTPVGYISPGDVLSGTGVGNGVTILSQTSGTPGGAGVYVTSAPTTASASVLTTQSTVLNVTAIASGDVRVDEVAFDAGGLVADGTTVLSQISGTAGSTGLYQINLLQHVAPETMDMVFAENTVVTVTIDQAPTITQACVQTRIV